MAMLPDGRPRARGKRPPQGEPVIDRAFSLLSAFDASQRRLSLTELSWRSGIPASSALRLAGHLLRSGALERDEEGRYCVGLRLLEVASLAPRGHGLRQVAMPFMSDLAQVTRQHVQLAVREGNEATLVERLSAHEAAPVQYRIGGRLPLHSTGIGQVLLAFAPHNMQEEFLSRPIYRQPDNVLISPDVMRRTLAEVRREQLAIYRREEQEVIVAVAAPISARTMRPWPRSASCCRNTARSRAGSDSPCGPPRRASRAASAPGRLSACLTDAAREERPR